MKRYSDVPQAGPTQGAPSSRAMSDPTAGDRAPAARPVRRAPTRRRTTGPLSAVDMSGAADVRPSASGPVRITHKPTGTISAVQWLSSRSPEFCAIGSRRPSRSMRSEDRSLGATGLMIAHPQRAGPGSAQAPTCQVRQARLPGRASANERAARTCQVHERFRPPYRRARDAAQPFHVKRFEAGSGKAHHRVAHPVSRAGGRAPGARSQQGRSLSAQHG